MDTWDSAVADRERLPGAAAVAHLRILVVVNRAVHDNCAGELKRDCVRPNAPNGNVTTRSSFVVEDTHPTLNRTRCNVESHPS